METINTGETGLLSLESDQTLVLDSRIATRFVIAEETTGTVIDFVLIAGAKGTIKSRSGRLRITTSYPENDGPVDGLKLVNLD